MQSRFTLVLWITLISLASSEDILYSDLGVKIPNQIENERISSSVNEFGFKLIKEMMRRNENENIVVSPAGISGLLAMALLGSVGESYEELARVLGFSEDVRRNRENHDHFGDLLRSLNINDTSSKTTYADVIFSDKTSILREAYRIYLNRVYGGDALTTDFKNPQEAKDLINDWVYNNTEGKIPNFLKEALPIQTKVVLLSALYFSGQWKYPFLIEYTKKLPFKGLTEDVMVEQMLNMGSFPYIFSHNDDLHMIALPYNDSVTTMYALKPRRPNDLNLTELLNRLDFNKIDALIAKMENRKCVIRYPKMDLQRTENLEESLKAIGVRNIFKPGQANFALMVDNNRVVNRTVNEIVSRINTGDIDDSRSLKEVVDSLPNPGVYVDTVLHDVKLTVDEYGTEAVAATSGVLARSAELFYADTPFFMFIRNERTKLVTFSAVILNPKSFQT
ncbi:unnamed protein product [Pieris macdunnoughi]|uniref:Serpin domain-containing protein n=1 Tax=Pieris macdunnoughi TaxID=345717 RepID=A0A821RUB1_9NEOP|nr:unnamed protein product [Pieris macdunnoughi]